MIRSSRQGPGDPVERPSRFGLELWVLGRSRPVDAADRGRDDPVDAVDFGGDHLRRRPEPIGEGSQDDGTGDRGDGLLAEEDRPERVKKTSFFSGHGEPEW